MNYRSKHYKKLCWRVLILWVLSTLSTALMASLPNLESREGYVALCTSQGIKWVAIDALSLGASTPTEQTNSDSQSVTSGDGSTPSELAGSLNGAHIFKHCSACILGSGNNTHHEIDGDSPYLQETYLPAVQTQISRLPANDAVSLFNQTVYSIAHPRAPPHAMI